MGVFGNLFGGNDEKGKSEKKVVPWIPLNSLEQLKEIEQKMAREERIKKAKTMENTL